MAAESGSLIGRVIGGTYEVRQLIGSGGMGEVFAADGKNGEKVAIKFLHDRAAQDPDMITRFQREATIAARIKSPYVAAIVGAGKERNGRLWIAFERLTGEALDVRLQREKYLAFDLVAQIVDDALQGLAAAHAAGVIHRDIKPANLFLERNEKGPPLRPARTRILDFGVSKILPRSGYPREPSLTEFGATLGSFSYMAPEQVRGSARVDERADLYALGAVAFRAITGRLPFEANNALALVQLKLYRDPPSLCATTGTEWPEPLERFLSRTMSRDRDKRFPTANEARSTWREVCEGIGPVASQLIYTPPVSRDTIPDTDLTDITEKTSYRTTVITIENAVVESSGDRSGR